MHLEEVSEKGEKDGAMGERQGAPLRETERDGEKERESKRGLRIKKGSLNEII